MKKLKVLQCVTIMNQGGLENFIMNVYRNIDKNKFEFDFLVQRYQEGLFDNEISKLGGKIYHISQFNPFHHRKYLNEIDKFFKEHSGEYDIVHTHNNSIGMYILRTAKKYNIPVRIAHSHSSKYSKNLKIIFFEYAKKQLKKYCNVKFACAKEASKFLFNNYDAYIIPNAIETDKFKFNKEYRENTRKELGINKNEYIIGHVGRFNKSKNHKFIIKVFKELSEENSNLKCLLVGSGESEENRIKNMVTELGLNDKVIFTGTKKDVYKYYNAMDIFLFPSIFEGLPLTLIEAQANGLNCIISNSIPNDCNLTELIHRYELSENIDIWKKNILKYLNEPRKDYINKIKSYGFDIKTQVKEIERIYLNEYVRLSKCNNTSI